MKLYTSKVVGEWLGITDREVRALRDKGVLSEEKPGLFKMKSVVQEYIQFKLGGDRQEKLLAARAEREQARAKLETMRMEEISGSLHRTEDVERALKTIFSNFRTRLLIFSNFRTRLLEIPMKYAGTLTQITDQGEAFDVLNDAVCEALNEISDYNAALAEVDQEDGNDEET